MACFAGITNLLNYGITEMTQDERWVQRYNEVVAFIKREHRNPSKYNPEEKLMVHFLKRGRKLMNAGD